MLKQLLVLLYTCSGIVTSSFPNLKEVSYSTGIEVQIENGSIFPGDEYKDHKNNKVSLDFQFNGTFAYRAIYDYGSEYQTIVRLVNGRKKCVKTVINSIVYSPDRNDDVIIPKTLTQLMVRQNSSEMMYMGTKKIRNVECSHWQQKTTLNVTNNTLSQHQIDFYFRHATTIGGESGNFIPVRIVEKTSQILIYEYFNFRLMNPPFDVFQAPIGTYCNSVDSMEPPQLPSIFSASLEYQIQGNRTDMLINAKFHYDTTAGLIRLDHHIKRKGKWYAVKDIMDRTSGLRYQAFSHYQCKITEYKEPNNSAIFNSHHIYVHIRDLIDHYNKHPDGYVYEGQALVRGVSTDVWIYRENATNVKSFNEIEYYFTNSADTFEVNSHEAIREYRGPVQIIGYYGDGRRELFRISIYDYSSSVFRESILTPARKCLELNSSVYIVTLFIRLPPEEMKHLHAEKDLLETLYKVFTQFTMVPRSRFAIELLITKKQVDVQLSIFEHPFKTKIQPGEPSAKELADKIKNGVLKYNINIQYGPNMTGEFLPRFFDGVQIQCGGKKEDCPSYTIQFFLLGFFIFVALVVGFVVCFFVVNHLAKRNGNSLIKIIRSNQKLDNESTTPERNFGNVEVRTSENQENPRGMEMQEQQ